MLLATLRDLPQASTATDAEVVRFSETHRLYGVGIGYVDAHLLAAVRLTPGASLWARDTRLLETSSRLGLAGNQSQ